MAQCTVYVAAYVRLVSITADTAAPPYKNLCGTITNPQSIPPLRTDQILNHILDCENPVLLLINWNPLTYRDLVTFSVNEKHSRLFSYHGMQPLTWQVHSKRNVLHLSLMVDGKYSFIIKKKITLTIMNHKSMVGAKL